MSERMQQRLGALHEVYELLNEKIARLRRARIIETDTAVVFKLEKQIQEIEEERRDLELKIDAIESKWTREIGEGQIEDRYDVLFCYHPLDREDVTAIVLSQNLKVLFYALEEKELFNKQIDAVAVFVGKMEPWRDNHLGYILAKLTDQKIPVIDVILKGVKKDPKFPIFLKTDRVVDFRKEDHPIEALETLIQEAKAGFQNPFQRDSFKIEG